MRIHQIAEAIDLAQLPKAASERVLVNLNDLTQQSLRRMQSYAQSGGVSLKPEVAREPLAVYADSMLFSQVLDGVIGNAIKFSDMGGQVLVRLEKMGEQAHLLVQNGGRVLNAKEIEKAFSEAEAKSPVSGRFAGLGIRLSLVKEIISRMGGKVGLESQTGKGTILHVTLPLTR